MPILQDMLNRGTADLNVREHLIDGYRLAAWMDKAAGNFSAALSSNQAALDGMKWFEEANRLTDQRIGKFASIYVARGQLLASTEDSLGAEQAWQRATDLLREHIANTKTPALIDPWLRLLMLRGEAKEATRLRADLDSLNYIPIQPWPMN